LWNLFDNKWFWRIERALALFKAGLNYKCSSVESIEQKWNNLLKYFVLVEFCIYKVNAYLLVCDGKQNKCVCTSNWTGLKIENSPTHKENEALFFNLANHQNYIYQTIKYEAWSKRPDNTQHPGEIQFDSIKRIHSMLSMLDFTVCVPGWSRQVIFRSAHFEDEGLLLQIFELCGRYSSYFDVLLLLFE
jgi:hypothetical protein